ncbi:MAG: hypothetical protein CK550_01855 [Gemmatimonadetes bacterium]|nr:MAG: hypothetical protein CK550_01855 [Gemmatimonadota bacterium]
MATWLLKTDHKTAEAARCRSTRMEVGLEAANAGCQQRARPADDCLHRDRNFNRSGSTIRRVSDAIADRASTDWQVAACPLTRLCASRAVGTAAIVGGAMPAGTHPSRGWDGRPCRRSPCDGGASGPSSGDGWSVGLLKWWDWSDQNLAKVRSPAS